MCGRPTTRFTTFTPKATWVLHDPVRPPDGHRLPGPGTAFCADGASGAFGSALKDLLERAGAEVVPLKYGVDYTDLDYSGADVALAGADVLVLAHGTKVARHDAGQLRRRSWR